MELTLEQAMQLALDKNLDLRSRAINPQILDYQLVTARAAFKPTLIGVVSTRTRSRQSTQHRSKASRPR